MTFSFHVPIAARLALALTTLSGPVLSATSPPAATVPEPLPPRLFLQTFSVGSQYFNGQAYLIAKPVQQVRAALVAEAGGVLAGFTEKSIDLTPDRNRWESEWYLAWLGNHPQAMKSIAQASLRALDAGTRDQLITPAERTAWGTVITRQSIAATFDKNDDEVRRRVNPPGNRAEWFRNTSGRVLLKPYETGEFITVADVSRFMDRSTPVTLLWYAGARTRRTVDGFDFFYCMTGVTCFVAPQIKYASDTSAFERPQVTQLLQRIAQRLEPLPATEVETLLSAWQRESPPEPEAGSLKPSLPPRTNTRLQTMPLGGLYGIGGGQARNALKALPDGRFVTTVGVESNGGLLIQLTGDQVQATPLRAPEFTSSTRVDPRGQLWTLSARRVAGEDPMLMTCVQVADIRKDSSAAADLARKPYCHKNWKEFSWYIDPRVGPMLYTDGHGQFPAYPRRFVTAQTGHAARIEDTLRRRGELVALVPAEHGSTPVGDLLTLGDGLAWFADLDLFTVSAASGKVEKSQALGGLKDMFFGSNRGDWVIAAGRLPGGASVIDVFQPSSGRVRRLGATTVDYLNAVARTAHGRLLALCDGHTIEVWDMRTGDAVASLTLGENERAVSIAFDWPGSRLWVQVDGRGVAVWPVPAALQDGADAADMPDQAVGSRGNHWMH